MHSDVPAAAEGAVTYTWDVFATVDGFGSYTPGGDWGAFWGTAGPEFLLHRAAQLAEPQRLVLGASTFRLLQHFHAALTLADDATDPVNTRLKHLPTTVVSRTLEDCLDWPDADVRRGDAVDVVRDLKQSSPVPLRSHGSPMLNRALVAAGLVDLIRLFMNEGVVG